MNKPETHCERRYINWDQQTTTRRRNAIGTRFLFWRIHEDGHRYEVEIDSKSFTVAPDRMIRVMAEQRLDEIRYDYDTRGDHRLCTHPWKKLRHDPNEYGGSRCTICGALLSGNGR